MGYLDLADRSWPVLRRLAGAHVAAYRASGGRIGHRIPGLRAPMLLLEHVGARTGATRTTPLLYIADGEDLVLVASKGGFVKHPAWFHNLRAHPETTVQLGAERRRVRARVATPEERPRLWRRATDLYTPYDDCRAHSGGREIPLVILAPR